MISDTKNAVGCVKEATRILGDKWTPQLIRSFINNPSLRFCQIESLVEGISPRTLSARLTSLESEGIIDRIATADTSRCEYRLTKRGRELEPILRAMNDWGLHHS